MAGTQVQFRRGTTAEHSTFTGAEGEITVDTTKDTAVVHDGSTAGGFPLVKESSVGTIASQNANNVTITGGSITGITDLAVADGGTGISSAGTSGNLLTSNGTVWQSAALTTGQLPAGSVLQVVQGSATTGASTTSATYSDIGLSATITPSKTSSKILAIASLNAYVSSPSSTAAYGSFSLVRGSTLINYSDVGLNIGGATSQTADVIVEIARLDSPSTTSATTYKVQFKSYSSVTLGTYYAAGESIPTIFLLEIAG